MIYFIEWYILIFMIDYIKMIDFLKMIITNTWNQHYTYDWIPFEKSSEQLITSERSLNGYIRENKKPFFLTKNNFFPKTKFPDFSTFSRPILFRLFHMEKAMFIIRINSILNQFIFIKKKRNMCDIFFFRKNILLSSKNKIINVYLNIKYA